MASRDAPCICHRCAASIAILKKWRKSNDSILTEAQSQFREEPELKHPEALVQPELAQTLK